MRLAVAPGKIATPSEFAKASSHGTFSAQAATPDLRMFEVFAGLSRQTEGSYYTLGLSYVRPADQREGAAKLDTFLTRRVGV